jgi:SAM-dependent methyltransferase
MKRIFIMQLSRNLISPRFSVAASHNVSLNVQLKTERNAVLKKISDGNYIFENRCCAICDSDVFDILAEHDRYGFPIQTTMCKKCGLLQTNPDMRDIDYHDFYTQHYRKLYIADLVGEPEDFFREEYWRGQRIADYVLKKLAISKNALIVEIGCGAGGILHAFRERGYRVIGTDLGIDNMVPGKNRGLDLRSGDLFDLKLQEAPALIIYSHVLEHIREPGRQLQRARELLGEDGHLYIEVPGVKEVHSNLFQADFLRTFHLAHIYNFSLQTLTSLLQRQGFERISGDEKIRSLFRPGKTQMKFKSDYIASRKYIERTEKWRFFYGFLFRKKNKILDSIDKMRGTLINFLRCHGLYDRARKLFH